MGTRGLRFPRTVSPDLERRRNARDDRFSFFSSFLDGGISGTARGLFSFAGAALPGAYRVFAPIGGSRGGCIASTCRVGWGMLGAGGEVCELPKLGGWGSGWGKKSC